MSVRTRRMAPRRTRMRTGERLPCSHRNMTLQRRAELGAGGHAAMWRVPRPATHGSACPNANGRERRGCGHGMRAKQACGVLSAASTSSSSLGNVGACSRCSDTASQKQTLMRSSELCTPQMALRRPNEWGRAIRWFVVRWWCSVHRCTAPLDRPPPLGLSSDCVRPRLASLITRRSVECLALRHDRTPRP